MTDADQDDVVAALVRIVEFYRARAHRLYPSLPLPGNSISEHRSPRNSAQRQRQEGRASARP
jgi:hypothetical protein